MTARREQNLLDFSLLSWPTFERDNLANRVHDSRVGSNGPPDDIIRVIHVDDDDLALFADFLADANEPVRLHGERVETEDACGVATEYRDESNESDGSARD